MITFATSTSTIPPWFRMPCIGCEILGRKGEAMGVVTATSGLGLASCLSHLDMTTQVMRTLTSYDLAGLRAAFIAAGLTTGQVAGNVLITMFQAAKDAAATGGPTEGGMLRAALAAYGIPSFYAEDGGVSYVLVAVDRTDDEGAAHTGPRVLLHSGEDAGRPADQHDEPWAASLYAADGEYINELFTARPGLPLAEECATTALSLACWLVANAHRYPRDDHRGPGEGVVYGRLPGSGGSDRSHSATDVMFGRRPN
ncbi:hypothetical protein ABZ568_00750 [Streptomyces olindensis]|uniref:Uncharacterized protein n=1 Tax=Streptomyces olindensis TaxID=358823 RepID=A0ABV2XLV8_9ACTN